MGPVRSRLLCLFLITLVPALPALWAQAPNASHGARKSRIDPDGIPGSLILCGPGDPAEKALDHFLDRARGKKARLVLVQLDEGDDVAAVMKRIEEQATRHQAEAIHVLRLTSKVKADEKLLQSLATASGVFLVGMNTQEMRSRLDSSTLAEELGKVLKRGGAIASTGAVSPLLAHLAVINSNSAAQTSAALGLLPDSVLCVSANGNGDRNLAKALANHPGNVGYEIDADTALIVTGRRLFAVGGGNVVIHLAASPSRQAKAITLSSSKRMSADLTALRRAARVRCGPEFPPRNPAPPVVEKGTLIIIGGGGMPKGLIQRFVELAGSKKARLVVFPTAVPDPIPKRDSMAEAFRRAGAAKVTVLPQRKLRDVESKEFLDTLKEATGIWFGGGRQWRFVDAYENTKAHALMLDVLRRGGVIAGSSAGASIQAEYMARGNPLGNLDIMAEGYEQGLGFLKGAAVDQHFSQRKRQKDMSKLIKTYPQLLGIGIDEATAIVVQGQTAEVVGRGKVYFYDSRRKIENGQPDYQAVSAGGSYDLKARKILENGK